MTFVLTSPAFLNGETIPAKYTCDGNRELSPPLAISGAPEGTKSFALIMDDPDIPQVARDAHGIETFDIGCDEGRSAYCPRAVFH